MSSTGSSEARVEELERRIQILEAQDETTLGRFTRWDWAACVVGTILLPILIVWRFSA